jgi:hypothetical protein
MSTCRNRGRRCAGWAVASFALVACLVPAGAGAALPDHRGWELVSPTEKNGGSIRAAGEVSGGGVFQAAADGESVTYSSTASFASPAQSAPPGSQYISSRVTESWSTKNVNVPSLSGSYGANPDGVPYQVFSPDLGRGLLLNGRPCRAEEGLCPVVNPPLAGTDAPTGYQNYYLRQGNGFEALIGASDVFNSSLDPAHFTVRLAGSSGDLDHVILETCAALTTGATEVPLGSGCDPAKQNLYEWSAGSGLSLVNSAPGAALAAQAGAISADGSRIYFTNSNDGNLYLRDAGQLKQVDSDAAGGGAFQTASSDGGAAYFTKGGHLWHYAANTDSATDLTPAGGVVGLLNASADGAYAYYLAADGLYVWNGGSTTKAAAGADSSNYPPATGTTRVSEGGTRLIFVSSASLTGYDNADQKTGLPDSQVFLYDAATEELACLSCRPNGTRPIGPSMIPGAQVNGQLPGATAIYKTRVLSADGNRVFFDSADSLAPVDVNRENDVYEWQPAGGSCANATGCIGLISDGRSAAGANFIDASNTGDDVFFVTDASLTSRDFGAFDLYDARVGGGFPEPPAAIPCFGDACVELPSEPVDPALNTINFGPGNPKVRYFKYRHKTGGKKCKSTAKHRRCAKKKGRKHGGKKAGSR